MHMFRINKKLIISIVFATVLLVSGILGFVVIPNQLNKFKAPSDAPTNLGTVSGNGGSAVMVGGYLYFTSGFVSNSEATLAYKQNEYNKVRGEGSIWRVKMGDGTVNYDNSYLEDWNEYKNQTPYAIAAKYGDALNKRVNSDDFKLIVPKIAGWEKTALWVFGDNLIYTSPNNQKNKYNKLQRHSIDFFRVNLRGLGHKKIHTIYSDEADKIKLDDFTAVSVNNNVYLLCSNGTNLVRVDMNGNVQTISSKIHDFALPIVSSYDNGVRIENGQQTLIDDSQSLQNSYSENMEYVYYTEEPDGEALYSGTKMMRYNIKTGAKETLRHGDTHQRFKSLANGSLIFEDYLTDDYAKLYVVDEFISKENFDQNVERFWVQQSLHTEETEVFISGEKTSRSDFFFIVMGANNKISMFSKSNNYVPVYIPNINDATEIISVTASNVMYKSLDGKYVTRSHSDGAIRGTADAPQSVKAGALMSTFHIVGKLGEYLTNLGPMFFYIKEVSQQDGNGTEVLTVAAMMNSSGEEFILARLADKFIPEIPES